MQNPSDETGRLLSYLLAIYEFIFGFIIADGSMSIHTTARPLLRGGIVFLLCGIGFHYFVNIRAVLESEYRRKARTLWLGVLFILAGISLSGFVSSESFINHAFLLTVLLYIVLNFLFSGVLRKTPLAGALVYGAYRGLAVYSGTVIAGRIMLADNDRQTLWIITMYALFHFICEFLRRSASERSTRLSVLVGFVMMLALVTGMFYYFSHTLDDIQSKLLVMVLILILLVLVSVPPLHAMRTMKAMPLLGIFPKGLAGGVVLTLTFFVFLKKDPLLLLLILLPAFIVLLDLKFIRYTEDTDNEIKV